MINFGVIFVTDPHVCSCSTVLFMLMSFVLK